MDERNNVFIASAQELQKIPVEKLKLGMYVSMLDRPWLETKFLFQGFELKTQADIKAVQNTCKFVYIDKAKQYKINLLNSTESTNSGSGLSGINQGLGKRKRAGSLTKFSSAWIEKRKPPPSRVTFKEEIKRAEKTFHGTSNLVKSFMDELRLDGRIKVEIAKKAVSECVDSIIQAPDALMWMTQLKHRDEYTSQHSMNVCILAIALGRHLNLSEQELNNVGLCGMMHDMGKMRIPLEVLNKPGELTASELKMMRNHTTEGWKLLLSTSDMYGGAIDVAYTHHERLDGKGYPRQLAGEQISPYARIVAIVDMYDAITSDRVYQKGRTHLEAINILTKAGGSHLDPAFTIKFIECLGIYPPGSIVELSSGEVAIVTEVNRKQKIRPKIIIILNEDKKMTHERMVDLSKMDLDASGQPYVIRKIIRADKYGININKYYQNGLLEKGLASV